MSSTLFNGTCERVTFFLRQVVDVKKHTLFHVSFKNFAFRIFPIFQYIIINVIINKSIK